MKQFGKILKFELKGYLKNKVFTGVTIFLVVAIAVAMFIPNIISAFKSGTTPSKDLPVMLVYAEDETLSKTVKEYFTQAFTGYNVKVADGTLRRLTLICKQSQYEGFQSGCCEHGIARGLQSERDDTKRAVPRTGERYYVGGYRKQHDDTRC